MKKFKKILLLSGATLTGMSLLTGCTTSSNNNLQSSQSSDNKDKKDTEKKPQYDTSGLKEETVKGGKFFTSFAGQWKTRTEQGVVITALNQNATEIQVTVETNDKLVTGVAKEWTSMSESKIEAMLKTVKPTVLTVNKKEINGRKAFVATYQLKSSSATGVQYYIQLDDTHTALVTYISVMNTSEMEKEVKNITSTIEYIE